MQAAAGRAKACTSCRQVKVNAFQFRNLHNILLKHVASYGVTCPLRSHPLARDAP